MDALKDQHVLILGLGASGLAMARWCAQAGARVTVADTRAAPPQLATLQGELPNVCFISGALDASLLQGTEVQLVLRSPGLTPQQTAIISEAARADGISVRGELGLFSQALKELQVRRNYEPKVLAVTGTNGKTTVTSLTGLLVARAGKTVAVAGNIGPTLLDTLRGHLLAATLPQVWVLELSSFQLDGAKTFEPCAAAVLNITQDHLDWHASMAAYSAAKANIFGQHGTAVLNRDDPAVMALLPPTAATASGARKGKARAQPLLPRAYVTFGTDLPQRPGDFGLEQVTGMTWLVRALEADASIKQRPGDAPDLHLQRLMPADALRIRGVHNALNALAALALAAKAGCAVGPMLYALRDYQGEAHRVQSIGVAGEVEFFDDSKGTNVGATVAALNALGAARKVVVILGGEGKGQDFSPLAEPVARHARAVLLIGRDAALIRAALADVAVPLIEAGSMTQAVALAHALAQAGDAVLLSPACASYDMFDDYEHRARAFRAAVAEAAHTAGLPLQEAARADSALQENPSASARTGGSP